MNNSLIRMFIFESPEDLERFNIFVRSQMEAGRTPQAATSEYKRNRSKAQNAFMWKALLEPIAQQAAPGGQRYVAEVWSQHLKELFLPDVNASGMQKWYYLPPDPRRARLLQAPLVAERRLVMGTSDLNIDEMKVYLDHVAEYAVHELGVHLPANPRDYDFGEAEARSSRRRAA
jgi:hypothetical protein